MFIFSYVFNDYRNYVCTKAPASQFGFAPMRFSRVLIIVSGAALKPPPRTLKNSIPEIDFSAL